MLLANVEPLYFTNLYDFCVVSLVQNEVFMDHVRALSL